MRELAGVWSGAVMYLRTTARANKDGSVVRYLALAHNQRVGAATKARSRSVSGVMPVPSRYVRRSSSDWIFAAMGRPVRC